MESVLEMQVACLLCCYFYSKMWAQGHKYGEHPVKDGLFITGPKETSEIIMIVLLIEHIIAYLFGIYRTYELKRYGKPNTLGIETAPCESRLKMFEIVIDFIIIVVVLVHFVKAGKEAFNDNPLNNFWILTDLIIMFISLPYTYMVQLIMVYGEINKNIFTLFQVQKRLLRERRNRLTNFTKAQWKQYFETTAASRVSDESSSKQKAERDKKP